MTLGPQQPVDLPCEERDALRAFTAATAALRKRRWLQQRTDEKFIVPRAEAPRLLARLADELHILQSDGEPYGTYLTLYFDTAEFAFYHAHRRGRRPRHKVRIRHYVERDLCFLETKTKDRYAVTTKERFPRDARDFELHDDDRAAIAEAIGVREPLLPAVWLRFPRVTLLSPEHPERLTIDLGIQATHDGQHVAYEDVCIVELKQRSFDARSPAHLVLRSLGLRPHRISKYCVGLSALERVERTNVFQPVMRELDRSTHA